MAASSISLSELNRLIRETTEKAFPAPVWIRAEILEMQVNRTGHCYLELIEKSSNDDSIIAKTRATIWAYKFGMLRPFFETTTGTQLKPGIKVLVKAEVAFHEIYSMSLNISDIDPSFTMGDMALRRQETIRKLKASGVMEMNRELPLSSVPQTIAVISSETAAGYGDFLDTLENNPHNFKLDIQLFPATVQGDAAERSIIQALETIYDHPLSFDVIVLIRGGGSQSDLDSFNSYELAMNIAQFPIPVLTGIGHERDETIADLVAHESFKTPTAVGEFLIDQLLEFEAYFLHLQERFQLMVNTIIQENKQIIQQHAKSLHHHLQRYVQTEQFMIKELQSRRDHLAKSGISVNKALLKTIQKQLDLVSPENVLRRGYSITYFNGKAISDLDEISPGDKIDTRVSKGTITSTVIKKMK